MPGSTHRFARGIRWLPLVVVVSLAGPSVAGWGSAVTVLAQADSGDQPPADMAAPPADDSTATVDQATATDATPTPEEAMPPQDGDVRLCVEVTSSSNGKVNVVTAPCPPESP